MRMIMKIALPVEPFNTFVRDGSAGSKIGKILEDTRLENVWFWEDGGQRGGIAVVDVPDASRIPSLAEPWFLTFDANVQLRIAMTPKDLQAAGLEALGKKYA